jgi:UDP-glucose 4-epimerase
LADGHTVCALVRPGSDCWRLEEIRGEVEIQAVDLRDAEGVDRCVRAAAPEWVFHLAAHGAYSWQTRARDIFDSTIFGTLNVVEACVRQGFDALIQAGSSSEYGPRDHPPSEEEAPQPDSEYAIAKVTATLLGRHLRARDELNVATLRLYSVYGPREDPRRLLPRLVAFALRGELPPLVDPTTARDFVHLDDVCAAFLAAAQSSLPQSSAIYNVGTGQQTTLRDLVDTAREVLSVSAEPQWGGYPARTWDTNVWVADPSKITAELGWRPAVELRHGVRGLADWLTEHPGLWARYGVSGNVASGGRA